MADAIVEVPQTPVERQSIGNCWIYAHATWAESMHKVATGEDFDVSQSYWTYWHWFEQIASGSKTKISTGGNWQTANGIVRKYGLMAEADFVSADVLSETSLRQKTALAAIDLSLESGALSTPEGRADKVLVRKELDLAWELSAELTATLDTVFGEGVTRTFSSTRSPAVSAGTPIVRSRDFAVAYAVRPGGPPVTKNLSNAMSEWRQAYYSPNSSTFFTRVKRALHDAQPVIVTWFVDFNALENREGERRGSFNLATLNEFGPGRQGGHMVVLHDYQATLPSGEVVPAGVTLDKNSPEGSATLAALLDPATKVDFLRVKNSWGGARPDRAFAPGMPGFHDLYLDYLNGPIARCVETDGVTDTSNCPNQTTPLQNVVLPPGY